ncbi:MAG: hypothetical protein ACYDB4_18120 [Candidatus Dormibacteraceae bacterium]
MSDRLYCLRVGVETGHPCLGTPKISHELPNVISVDIVLKPLGHVDLICVSEVIDDLIDLEEAAARLIATGKRTLKDLRHGFPRTA